MLRAFAGRLDFKNLDFDIALRYTDALCVSRCANSRRQMLTHFRLPGEAQKIDRIMNSFAVRFYLQNKTNGVFKSSGTSLATRERACAIDFAQTPSMCWLSL